MKSITYFLLILAIVSCTSVSQTDKALLSVFSQPTVLKPLEAELKNPVRRVDCVLSTSNVPLGHRAVIDAKSKSGPFRIIAYVDLQGKILALSIAGHKGNHGRAVEGESFLTQFRKWNILSVDTMESEVDAVSGATISSNAVIRYLRRAQPVLRNILLHKQI